MTEVSFVKDQVVPYRVNPRMSESFITRRKGFTDVSFRKQHENYENHITNGGNTSVFQRKKVVKITKLRLLWKIMIISFCMFFFAQSFAFNEAHKDHQIQ